MKCWIKLEIRYIIYIIFIFYKYFIERKSEETHCKMQTQLITLTNQRYKWYSKYLGHIPDPLPIVNYDSLS